jgi:hypothetical protein
MLTKQAISCKSLLFGNDLKYLMCTNHLATTQFESAPIVH